MFQRWLECYWRKPSQRWQWADLALKPLAWLYGMAVASRRWLYAKGFLKAKALPVPVIVVGNVVVGGAGKTPVVIALAQALMEKGIRVGVIARGYKRRGRGSLEVHAGRTAVEVGDEPLLIHLRTQAPTFVAKKRWEAGRALLMTHPQTEVILCDDGLQHWALQRDVQVCVFPSWGIGNGQLLPAGPLREPWEGKSDQADVIIQSSEGEDALFALGQLPMWKVVRQMSHVARNAHGQSIDLNVLAAASSAPIYAVAGIANPESFFEMLRARGLTLQNAVALRDHHDFSLRGVPPALDGLPEDAMVLCTEKDAVKLWPLWPEVWAVPLQISLTGELVDGLMELARARHAARSAFL